MMSQEDLAYLIHVSRQMITNWERGIVIPSIEYLIDLSNLFGVTIDSLIKDDDCQSIEKNSIEMNQLSHFLVKAKKETYANKSGKIDSYRKASHDYFYQDDTYQYLDSFVGSSKFAGEEVVYEKDRAVWSMNYYGKVIDDHFNGDFLKDALKHVPASQPLRGPESYSKGDYHYCHSVEGDMECFHGKETIFYQNIKVYECYFHGGILE